MIGVDENNLPGLKEKPKEGHQRIEMFLSCRQLRNRDLMSLSDPQVRIYTMTDECETLFGETEVIKDNLNPNFVKSFSMEYIFEVKQPLHFMVIDIDDKSGNFDLLGHAYTTLGDIMGSRNQILIIDILDREKKGGKLVIRTEIVDGIQSFAKFEISGEKLKNNAGIFSKSSPFFQLSRVHEETTNIVVYQSQTVKKSLNPVWGPCDISLKTLCNNDLARPILCSIYHKKSRTNKLMGQCTFSIDELKAQTKPYFELKKPKSKTRVYGHLKVNNLAVTQKPSFLQYLKSGIQLNVVAAIDYTTSNGNPKSVTSLHAIHRDGTNNDYQNALSGVCDILLSYDYDKKVPVYGFGGKPFGETTVSHCFPLTGNEQENYAYGLDGIMSVYKNSLQQVVLASPTFFKSVMAKGMEIAIKAKQEGSTVYTILLILTDGLIHDMQHTIDCLVDSSDLPLSVIIVGVGNEDFSLMETLDADNGRMLCNSKGVPAKRDLVQFVAFNKFKGNKEALAEEVLAEVPRQMIEYMTSQGIAPVDPVPQVNVEELMKSRSVNRRQQQIDADNRAEMSADDSAADANVS